MSKEDKSLTEQKKLKREDIETRCPEKDIMKYKYNSQGRPPVANILKDEIHRLYDVEKEEEIQIGNIKEECSDIKRLIEENKKSYENIIVCDTEKINRFQTVNDNTAVFKYTEELEYNSDDDPKQFLKEVEKLRQITEKTLTDLKSDELKKTVPKNVKTPKLIRKQLLKSPVTKRKEIKKLFDNHRDCENSDILQEIFRPVNRLSPEMNTENINCFQECYPLDDAVEDLIEKTETTDTEIISEMGRLIDSHPSQQHDEFMVSIFL